MSSQQEVLMKEGYRLFSDLEWERYTLINS